ncbi:hypothetical protein [Galactobacter sp.]|uniref:hypothetical protein n=1 Tax=Galactobacter sp. TaxID=2676125 RepID=UPI0025B915E6|nr:hypothetical protein [Galactobacter sp.]
MSLKRKLTSIAAAAGIAAASTVAAVATAAPAQALPYACASSGQNYSGLFVNTWGACYQGTGSYRLVSLCREGTKYGAWTSGGQRSWVNCVLGTNGTYLRDPSGRTLG